MTAFLSASVTAASVDLITKQNESNILIWIGWVGMGLVISLMVAVLFRLLLWLQPSLLNNELVYYLMVVFVASSITVLVYWEGL